MVLFKIYIWIYSFINYALRNTWLTEKMDMIFLKHKKDWYVRVATYMYIVHTSLAICCDVIVIVHAYTPVIIWSHVWRHWKIQGYVDLYLCC